MWHTKPYTTGGEKVAKRNRRIVERKRINDDIKSTAVFLGFLHTHYNVLTHRVFVGVI